MSEWTDPFRPPSILCDGEGPTLLQRCRRNPSSLPHTGQVPLGAGHLGVTAYLKRHLWPASDLCYLSGASILCPDRLRSRCAAPRSTRTGEALQDLRLSLPNLDLCYDGRRCLSL